MQGFSHREPGQLQTGLNPLWKMVREESLSSRPPRFYVRMGKGAA
ncbi:hypothetical protein [Paenibacillus macerans]|nr:hypothetical protein [Paenibacillus macerans]